MAPAIKLTYFDLKGRAEATRLALTIGGIEFEDKRVSGAEFQEIREKGCLPFKSLPVLTVDGETYAESDSHLRYAGKVAGLEPKCPKAVMKVDSIISVLETIITALFTDASKESREKFVNETIPRYVSAIEDIYAKTDGPYLLGDKLSIADIKVVVILEPVNDAKKFEHVPSGCLDKYKSIIKLIETFNGLEKVKEWNDAHA